MRRRKSDEALPDSKLPSSIHFLSSVEDKGPPKLRTLASGQSQREWDMGQSLKSIQEQEEDLGIQEEAKSCKTFKTTTCSNRTGCAIKALSPRTCACSKQHPERVSAVEA